MKIKVLVTAIAFSLSSLTYASSCTTDITQMYTKIGQFGSITTQDGMRVNMISNLPGNSSHCYATGYYNGSYVCGLTWKVNNWGNTLHCS